MVATRQQVRPRRCGLVGISRTYDVEVGDGTQRGEMFDGLMGRAVFAESDGIVRPHVDRIDLHERSQSNRWTHVVGELQERAAVGARRSVQHDSGEHRAHRVLADTEVQRAAVGVGRPLLGGDRGRAERRRPVHGGVVRACEVGRTAPQFRQDATERREHLARRRAGREIFVAGSPRRDHVAPSVG